MDYVDTSQIVLLFEKKGLDSKQIHLRILHHNQAQVSYLTLLV
jgi:hypothetical protein